MPASDESDLIPNSKIILKWKVHLLKRKPERLAPLLLIFACAAFCVWLIFRNLIPALAALVLLLTSTCDFFLPVSYQLTEQGAQANGLLSRDFLAWKEVLRVLPLANGVVLSPLPAASRLDAFRGVTLRFASDGEPGDRESVRNALAEMISPQAPA